MLKLINGIHHFQNNLFDQHRKQFENLAGGQDPKVLFITCSDSRINPNLITHTGPGDLFVLRNAGNIVPPYGAGETGVEATIEYALTALDIRDIVVCGHSHCGAMAGLLKLDKLEGMPSVKRWLGFAERTRRVVCDHYHDLADESQLNVTIQENVLAQIENLQTHPAVATRLRRGDLDLHAWVYKFETGEVFHYDSAEGQFFPLMGDSTLQGMSSNRKNSAESATI
jgi:carbonic anhydrase